MVPTGEIYILFLPEVEQEEQFDVLKFVWSPDLCSFDLFRLEKDIDFTSGYHRLFVPLGEINMRADFHLFLLSDFIELVIQCLAILAKRDHLEATQIGQFFFFDKIGWGSGAFFIALFAFLSRTSGLMTHFFLFRLNSHFALITHWGKVKDYSISR